MFLLSIVFLVFVIQLSLKGVREYQQFQQAPVCSGTGFYAWQKDDCRLIAPMTVTDKWYKDIGYGSKSQDMRWTLELRPQPDRGPTYRAEFEGGSWYHQPRVYREASIGETLNTERWRDKVMWVSTGGIKHWTDDHPQPSLAAYVWIGSCLCGSLFWLVALVAGVRKLQRPGAGSGGASAESGGFNHGTIELGQGFSDRGE